MDIERAMSQRPARFVAPSSEEDNLESLSFSFHELRDSLMGMRRSRASSSSAAATGRSPAKPAPRRPPFAGWPPSPALELDKLLYRPPYSEHEDPAELERLASLVRPRAAARARPARSARRGVEPASPRSTAAPRRETPRRAPPSPWGALPRSAASPLPPAASPPLLPPHTSPPGPAAKDPQQPAATSPAVTLRGEAGRPKPAASGADDGGAAADSDSDSGSGRQRLSVQRLGIEHAASARQDAALVHTARVSAQAKALRALRAL